MRLITNHRTVTSTPVVGFSRSAYELAVDGLDPAADGEAALAAYGRSFATANGSSRSRGSSAKRIRRLLRLLGLRFHEPLEPGRGRFVLEERRAAFEEHLERAVATQLEACTSDAERAKVHAEAAKLRRFVQLALLDLNRFARWLYRRDGHVDASGRSLFERYGTLMPPYDARELRRPARLRGHVVPPEHEFLEIFAAARPYCDAPRRKDWKLVRWGTLVAAMLTYEACARGINIRELLKQDISFRRDEQGTIIGARIAFQRMKTGDGCYKDIDARPAVLLAWWMEELRPQIGRFDSADAVFPATTHGGVMTYQAWRNNTAKLINYLQQQGLLPASFRGHSWRAAAVTHYAARPDATIIGLKHRGNWASLTSIDPYLADVTDDKDGPTAGAAA